MVHMIEAQKRSLALPPEVWAAAEKGAAYEDSTVAEFVAQAIMLHAAVSLSRRATAMREWREQVPPVAVGAAPLFAGTIVGTGF